MGYIWLLQLPFTSQSTTSSTSPSLTPSNPLILAPYKFRHIATNTNAYKYSFFPRTIPFWNNLPTTAVTATSPEAFQVYALPIIRTFFHPYLGKIDKWYEENEMRRNHDKYKVMVMGKTSREPVFKCEGTSIPLVEEVELLGVTVDDKLMFESQFKKICRKVSQQIAVLKRMKKLLPFKLREKLYRAFIASHFNYCAESWHFCSNRLTGKLQKLNERALRFVYQDKISTYQTLVVKNRYTTFYLANQRLAKVLNTVFGAIKNGNVPTSISELLSARNSNYNLSGCPRPLTVCCLLI